MEREIRLYGSLAKFIGHRKFVAEVASAGEAIRMLLANFPGLDRHMADQHYRVIVDNYESDLQELHDPASQTIKIVPVLGGAGGGVGKILAGVALVALALVNPFGAAAIGTFGLTAPIAVSALLPAVGAIGASLVFGGVAQMLTPTPQMGQISTAPTSFATTENTEMDPQKSYSFSGIQNTSQQGVPVPLIYGETFVGSVVISAGIDTDNI